MIKLAVAMAFLALNLFTYHFLAVDAAIPPREPFSHFPMELGDGWICNETQSVGASVERRLGVTDYLLCDFRRDGKIVNLYIGYHEAQLRKGAKASAESSIHPPAHCLPGGGWDIIDNQTTSMELGGVPVVAKRLVIAKDKSRHLVYYWYHSRGRIISEDWQKVLYLGWDRASRGRSDGSLVRFTTPIVGNDVAAAEAVVRDLAPSVVAQLPRYVPD